MTAYGDTLDMFSEGDRRRDEAMDRAERGAGKTWNERALEAVQIVARREPLFTTDAVWSVLGRNVAEPRAMGPVMRRAQTAEIVAPTASFVKSQRPERHSGPMRVWKSLIF